MNTIMHKLLRRVALAIILFSVFNSLVIAQEEERSTSKTITPALSYNVTVGGALPISGSFPAYVGERLDQYLTRLFSSSKSDDIIGFKYLRGLKLKRADGTVVNIDLLKYRNTGDLALNPYLKNDDVIILPMLDMERNYFVIEGAVNKPGRYQFVDGDNIQNAIEVSLGINPAFENIKGVEISRISYSGESVSKQLYPLSSTELLQRGDIIKVLADETQRRDARVVVMGQVKNPGYYLVPRAGTSVEDAIIQSGGILEDADAENVMIFKSELLPAGFFSRFYEVDYYENQLSEERETNTELVELIREITTLQFNRMSNMSDEDSSYFRMENNLSALLNAETINLKDTTYEKRGRMNIVRKGDIIIVPKRENQVQVLGQVSRPGRIEYKQGANYTYYINAAGGVGEFADEDVMIIKKGTNEWITAEDYTEEIQAGDRIWVNKKPIRTFNYYVGQTATILGILGSIATVILVVMQVSK